MHLTILLDFRLSEVLASKSVSFSLTIRESSAFISENLKSAKPSEIPAPSRPLRPPGRCAPPHPEQFVPKSYKNPTPTMETVQLTNSKRSNSHNRNGPTPIMNAGIRWNSNVLRPCLKSIKLSRRQAHLFQELLFYKPVIVHSALIPGHNTLVHMPSWGEGNPPSWGFRP